MRKSLLMHFVPFMVELFARNALFRLRNCRRLGSRLHPGLPWPLARAFCAGAQVRFSAASPEPTLSPIR
jgi:hypothetical protein